MFITIIVAIVMAIIFFKISIPYAKAQDRLNAKTIVPSLCFLFLLLSFVAMIDYGSTHGNNLFIWIGVGGWFFSIGFGVLISNVIAPKIRKNIINKKGKHTVGQVEKFIFSSSVDLNDQILSKKYHILVSYIDENNVLKTVKSNKEYEITVLSFFTSLNQLDILVYKDTCIILNEVPEGYYDDKLDFDKKFVDLPQTKQDLLNLGKEE